MKKKQLINISGTDHSKDLKLLNCNLPIKKISQKNVKHELNFPNELNKTYSIQQNFMILDKIRYEEDVKETMSRSLILLKKNRKNSMKQKFKKDLMTLQSQIANLSPQSIQRTDIKTQKAISKINKSNTKNSSSKKPIKIIQTMNSMLNNRSSQYISIQTQDGDILQPNYTNTDLFQKINKIIQQDSQNRHDISLQMQSKFIEVKKKHKEQDYKSLNWITQNIIQSHEQLLEQENKYLRQNLIQFTSTISQQRLQLEQLREKYKNVKKEHFKNKKNIQKFTKIIKQLQKQLRSKEPLVLSLQQTIEQYLRCIQTLEKKKSQLQERFQTIQTQYQQFQERFSTYRTEKQKQIQGILEDKQKQKNELQEMIYQKHKQIEQLTLYIQKLNSKKQSKNDNQDIAKGHIIQNDKQFEQSNSICLSLAQAESLKHIIQAKQQAHRQEIASLLNYQNEQKQKYLIIIDRLTQTVKQFEIQMHSTIESIYLQNQSIQQSYLKDNQFQEQSPKYFLSQQFNYQLKTMHYGRRIKKLYNTLSEERKQKIKLMQKITSLQQHCVNVQKQQDDELQQLFEKCVNELQKQKQINMKLNSENIHLKSKLNIMYNQTQKFFKIQY